MKKHFLLFLLTFASITALAAKPAYTIYNAKGKKVSYNKMIKQLKTADIILFGEQHNSAIAHWLQFEVTTDLFKYRQLILGAEMFEADNQMALNAYLDDSLDYTGLDSMARLWPNYKTDYAPLVDFAKDKSLKFIATNIPRRYANLVYKRGFESLDSLSTLEKSWIAPLPMEYDPNLPRYKNILGMMGSHGSPRLVMAQATKDATMAHFILKNYIDNHLFIHYNGAYHSDYYEGILWYLKKQAADLKYATISTVTQKNVCKLEDENIGIADFVICVDEHVTTTY